MIAFEKVKPDERQITHLYQLLSDRPHQISHRQMPTFEEHATFVQNNPYRVWYIVHEDEHMVGSVYLTDQNTIGINIDDRRVETLLSVVIAKIKADFDPVAGGEIHAGRLFLDKRCANEQTATECFAQ